MRSWSLGILLGILGCAPRYYEPMPELIMVPPDLPETVLRIPREFQFTDYVTGKQYFFRRYTVNERDAALPKERLGRNASSLVAVHAEGELRLELVTILESGAKDERLATEEERAYALGVLQAEWVRLKREDLLWYHTDAVERERTMRSDLLDQQLEYSTRVIEGLKEERATLHAELTSIRETPDYKAPEGHVEWLEKELARVDFLILERTAFVHVVRYQKYLRDGRFQRSSKPMVVREWIPVRHLLERGLSGDRLVADIRHSVRPESWEVSTSILRISGGYLEVANTRAVLDQVRGYLAQQR